MDILKNDEQSTETTQNDLARQHLIKVFEGIVDGLKPNDITIYMGNIFVRTALPVASDDEKVAHKVILKQLERVAAVLAGQFKVALPNQPVMWNGKDIVITCDAALEKFAALTDDEINVMKSKFMTAEEVQESVQAIKCNSYASKHPSVSKGKPEFHIPGGLSIS